jgi:uncharacterized damage-inducible protein DinB
MATAANPYAGFLGQRDALSVLAETSGRVTQYLERLGPSAEDRSWAPGKWTIRQLICHLADCEIAFSYRWRQVVAEPNHTVQTFDQDAWAANYPVLPMQDALASFKALRGWNLSWLRGLPPAAFDKRATHPERGDLTLRDFLELTAGHDLNHLGQLEQAAKASG